MRCLVIGYGHLEGVSKKTGKPYSFYNVSVTFPGELGYKGDRVMSLTVNDDLGNVLERSLPFEADVYKSLVGNSVNIVPIE